MESFSSAVADKTSGVVVIVGSFVGFKVGFGVVVGFRVGNLVGFTVGIIFSGMYAQVQLGL